MRSRKEPKHHRLSLMVRSVSLLVRSVLSIIPLFFNRCFALLTDARLRVVLRTNIRGVPFTRRARAAGMMPPTAGQATHWMEKERAEDGATTKESPEWSTKHLHT